MPTPTRTTTSAPPTFAVGVDPRIDQGLDATPELWVTIHARNADVVVCVPLADVAAALAAHDVRTDAERVRAIRRAASLACVSRPRAKRAASSCRCPNHTAEREGAAARDAHGCPLCRLIHGETPIGEVARLQVAFLESLDLLDLATVHAECPGRLA